MLFYFFNATAISRELCTFYIFVVYETKGNDYNARIFLKNISDIQNICLIS